MQRISLRLHNTNVKNIFTKSKLIHVQDTKSLTSDLKTEMSTLIEIGSAIREKRRKLNMTQTDLAEQLNVTRQAIGKIEKGDPEVGSKSLYDDIAKLLDLRFNMTFPLDNEPFQQRKKKERKKNNQLPN